MSYRVLLMTLIILTSFGCEKVIPYDEQTYTPSLVVNGMIQAGEPISIRVTESASILEDYGTQYEEINDCQARLFENGLQVESLSSGNEGAYDFTHEAQPGARYRIELDHARLPNVSCETRVPGAVSILEATGAPGDDFGTDVSLKWQDSENADYYQVLMYQDYNQNSDLSLVGWTTSSPYFNIDPLGDGESYYWNDGTLLDELFKNGTAELRLNVQSYFDPNDPEEIGIVAVLLGCSESYYRYRSSLSLYEQSDGGLFSQPVQVYSNVDGGLGILGASSKSSVTVEF